MRKWRISFFAVVIVFVILGIGENRITSAAPDPTCGGISTTAGTVTLSRQWAHCIRYSPSSSDGLSLTPSGYQDYDPMPETGCDTTTNHWDASLTEYEIPSLGTGVVSPPIGASTIWTPTQWTDTAQVRVILKDNPTSPIDDDDTYKYVDVKAFEVKVTMQRTVAGANAVGGSGPVGSDSMERWEYESTLITNHYRSWTTGSSTYSLEKWSGSTANDEKSIEVTSTVTYTYRTVPDNADTYGGSIKADTKNSGSYSASLGVDDADFQDADTYISLSLGPQNTHIGSGVGVSWI